MHIYFCMHIYYIYLHKWGHWSKFAYLLTLFMCMSVHSMCMSVHCSSRSPARFLVPLAYLTWRRLTMESLRCLKKVSVALLCKIILINNTNQQIKIERKKPLGTGREWKGGEASRRHLDRAHSLSFYWEVIHKLNFITTLMSGQFGVWFIHVWSIWVEVNLSSSSDDGVCGTRTVWMYQLSEWVACFGLEDAERRAIKEGDTVHEWVMTMIWTEIVWEVGQCTRAIITCCSIEWKHKCGRWRKYKILCFPTW